MYLCSHSTEEETKAQTGEIFCPKLQNYWQIFTKNSES
jgi:hypothetical protein